MAHSIQTVTLANIHEEGIYFKFLTGKVILQLLGMPNSWVIKLNYGDGFVNVTYVRNQRDKDKIEAWEHVEYHIDTKLNVVFPENS